MIFLVDNLINNIVSVASYGGVIGVVLALCEWAVSFFYRAITDKLGRGR